MSNKPFKTSCSRNHAHELIISKHSTSIPVVIDTMADNTAQNNHAKLLQCPSVVQLRRGKNVHKHIH